MNIEIVKADDLREIGLESFDDIFFKIDTIPDEKFAEWLRDSKAVVTDSNIEMSTGIVGDDRMAIEGRGVFARNLAQDSFEKLWDFANDMEEEDLSRVLVLKAIGGKEYILALEWHYVGAFLLKKAGILSEV
jgi:hypothetical protein